MFRYTPYLPDGHEVSKLAEEVAIDSAELFGAVSNAPETLDSIKNLVVRVNSYYSNLIEGSDTSPYAVEEAMRQKISDKPEQRVLQEESLAHIMVNAEVARMVESDPYMDVTSPDFIKFIHGRFYEYMPSIPRVIKGDGIEVELEPGEFRRNGVTVSNHIAPDHQQLDKLMADFHQVYKLDPSELKSSTLPKIAAAHHRYVFCHPFLDGNGRTGRILTEAMLHKTGLKGYALWSMSRGLARQADTYKSMLSVADASRKGSLDGRGELSQDGLNRFSRFFMETALDQIHYMNRILGLGNIKSRLDVYVNNVRATDIPLKDGVLPKLRPESTHVMQALFHQGRLTRGEAIAATGLGERTGRKVISDLIAEGIATPLSDSHKSDLKLGFTPHLTINLFPDLYPEKYLTLEDQDDYALSSKLDRLRGNSRTSTSRQL